MKFVSLLVRMVGLIVGAVGLMLQGCQISAPPTPERVVLARVGTRTIDAQALQRRFAREHLHADDAGAAPREYEQLHRRAILEDMINQHLLLQEAERAHVSVGHDDVENLFLRVRSGYSEPDFMDMLQKSDMTISELKVQLRENIMVRRYLQNAVYARVAVVDNEIDRILAQHPEMMDSNQRIQVRHIVVKTKEEAEQVRRAIVGGLNFVDAAMQYSIAPDSKHGGDLGLLERGALPKSFEDVCFALAPGNMSEVVGAPSGFYLFYVVKKEPDAARDIEQVRATVEAQLRREKERVAEQEKIKQLRAASNVIIEEDQLEKHS